MIYGGRFKALLLLVLFNFLEQAKRVPSLPRTTRSHTPIGCQELALARDEASLSWNGSVLLVWLGWLAWLKLQSFLGASPALGIQMTSWPKMISDTFVCMFLGC